MESVRLFLRLTPYIQSRWKLTCLAYVCTIASLALNLTQPFLLSYFIDQVLIAKEEQWLSLLLILSAACAVLSIVLTIIRSGIFRYLGIRNTLDIRDVILAHVRRIPLTEIEKYGAGKFAALMGMDAATMGNFLNHIVVELSTQWFTMLFSVAMIFYMDWRLGIISLVSIPLLMFIPRLFSRPIARYAAHVRNHNEEIGTHLFESIEGSREIRAFSLESWEKRRNDAMYANLVKASTRETLFNMFSGQAVSLVISFMIVSIYWYGSRQIHAGTLTIGMMVAAVQYLNSALIPIQIMNSFFGELQKGNVAMTRIEAFLGSDIEPAAAVGLAAASQADEAGRTDRADQPDRTDRPARSDQPDRIGQADWPGRSQAAVSGDAVECRHLNVSCDGTAILRDIHFAVGYGQVAAFVGRSGSGKSSLLKTLMGFMPIDRAELYIASRSYDRWSRHALSRHVGMVFQESYLFAGTIFENIALGHLRATEEEVYEAACQARLQTLIDSLPDGLHTSIDHRGFQLSGGQRQRIAIARVMLRKPEILILDEPTSALDRESEEHVLDALKALMKDKTTLIATHRPDTMAAADIIYVLDGGRVTDFGKHDELLRQNALYRALVAGEDAMGKREGSA